MPLLHPLLAFSELLQIPQSGCVHREEVHDVCSIRSARCACSRRTPRTGSMNPRYRCCRALTHLSRVEEPLRSLVHYLRVSASLFVSFSLLLSRAATEHRHITKPSPRPRHHVSSRQQQVSGTTVSSTLYPSTTCERRASPDPTGAWA